MEINFGNQKAAVAALRKCAAEHKNDVTDTFSVRVSDLCNDVADYLESYTWKQRAHQFSEGIRNKEFREKLAEYPDDAFIAVECCNPKNLHYYEEVNGIYID